MVTDNHYRWDFIQLADDPKPTPATSPKVADGSTLYTSDDSKLYVWYKNQWYEKTATGGGGGIPTTVIDTIWFGTQAQYDLIEPKAEKTLYLVQEETENALLSSPRIVQLPTVDRSINLNKSEIIEEPIEKIEEEEVEEPEEIIEETNEEEE